MTSRFEKWRGRGVKILPHSIVFKFSILKSHQNKKKMLLTSIGKREDISTCTNCLRTPTLRNIFQGTQFVAVSATQFFMLLFLFGKRVIRTVGLSRQFKSNLPRTPNSFVKPHPYNGAIIYDVAYNFAFHQKLEFFQYCASLKITGGIRETFRDPETGLYITSTKETIKRALLFG